MQLARTMLYGIAEGEVRPYMLAIGVILFSWTAAYWLPAARARDTDLTTTLRAD